MADDIDRELSQKYCPRFAEIAVKMGFISLEQAKQAISEQVDDNINDKPHRLIGRILLDKGWMTPEQIDTVMNDLFKSERE